MNVFCLFLGWKPCTNMKYYLIAGEASGDLHASHLIKALRREDADASFRFIGGDRMETEAADSGTLVRHYSTLAYMGFIPVLMHLPTILRGMTECKKDIASWQPDVVILVDYAGFNLKIAKYIKNICPAYAPFITYHQRYGHGKNIASRTSNVMLTRCSAYCRLRKSILKRNTTIKYTT